MENKGVCIVPLLISVVSIFVMVQVLSFKPFHANVFFFLYRMLSDVFRGVIEKKQQPESG